MLSWRIRNNKHRKEEIIKHVTDKINFMNIVSFSLIQLQFQQFYTLCPPLMLPGGLLYRPLEIGAENIPMA
jgi:hypothetical protein